MREVWFCLVNCVNCGKQTMIDLKNPEDNCQFCGKNARKKEVIMAEKEGMIDRAKYEAMGRLKRSKWIKEHLEEIMVDIRSMSKDEVVEKWPFGPSTYGKLRRIHAPEIIGQQGAKTLKKPTQKTIKETTGEDVALTEHERYLILLGYQQATREFLKNL